LWYNPIIMDFSTKIEKLTSVGQTTAKRLQKLGINNANDLLYYFPFRYEDYRLFVKISDLKDGQTATIKGKIELIANKRSWRKRKIITEALVTDESGTVRVVWFGQPFIAKNLRQGEEIFLSGKIKEDMMGAQMAGPVYEKATGKNTHTGRLAPMYPLTSGLTQKQIRFLVSQVIGLANQTEEWLPADFLKRFNLIPLSEALGMIHFPENEDDLNQSVARLKFDELFLLQLKAEMARAGRSEERAPELVFQEKQIKEFVDSLPFILTKTQKISAWEILQNIGGVKPMNRLLSGDVGSGKTVVAGLAMFNAGLNHCQSALMAPTEILAIQHYQTLRKILGDKMSIGLLTQSQALINDQKLSASSKHKKRKYFEDNLAGGQIDIAVGTHALLSENIKFKQLGLVVVDEQHRFGVEQRKAIKLKGRNVHFLSMTATPIPRSLALLLYGDLDISLISELPAGRRAILTRLVEPINRFKAYDFIRGQIKKGRQVFVVCPLIEEKETGAIIGISEKKSVMAEYKKLSTEIFVDLSVDFLHGKMPAEQKNAVLKSFRDQKIDILVSTSVIEVGLDMPNASVMMIEGAERFGLAQLHQFRGRVGRSTHQSYCFLFMENESPKAMNRLKFFEKNNNGFKLAEKDLENRGPGEVYGTAQSGLKDLRLARLTDYDIIKKARQAAQEIMAAPERYKGIFNKFKRFKETAHLE